MAALRLPAWYRTRKGKHLKSTNPHWEKCSANRNREAYFVPLMVGDVERGAAVSKPLYDALSAGDQVRVKVRRTRLSKRLLITDVSR